MNNITRLSSHLLDAKSSKKVVISSIMSFHVIDLDLYVGSIILIF
jgi:hypothetical protein